MKKVSNRRSPPGLEWTILKKLPKWMAATTLIPAFMAFFARVNPFPGWVDDPDRFVASVDILAISVVLTGWTVGLTIAIGCAMVWIMKGPTYEADAYELEDSDRPRSKNDKRDD